MADFADSTAVSADLELLETPPAPTSPALPAGDGLLQANLYAVCELDATLTRPRPRCYVTS